MTTTIPAQFQMILDEVRGLPWITCGDPEMKEGATFVEFNLTANQFALAQSIISGAVLGPTLEDSLQFLRNRSASLHEDAKGYEDGPCGYSLPMGYCSSGAFETEGALYLWYETTSGTILAHAINEEGEHLYQVLIPSSRKGGYHNMECDRVKAGMTKAQYDRWYNAHCLTGKEAEYAEWAEWHNRVMVPLGYEEMFTGEQFQMRRQIDEALNPVLGGLGSAYGLQPKINSLLGDFKPAPVLQGEHRAREARYILQNLERARAQWRSLMQEWGVVAEDSPASGEDYDEE